MTSEKSLASSTVERPNAHPISRARPESPLFAASALTISAQWEGKFLIPKYSCCPKSNYKYSAKVSGLSYFFPLSIFWPIAFFFTSSSRIASICCSSLEESSGFSFFFQMKIYQKLISCHLPVRYLTYSSLS